jgi:hypothetical protein
MEKRPVLDGDDTAAVTARAKGSTHKATLDE